MTVPVNPGKPVVSGIPQAGQLLTTAVGCWLNGPTSYTYTWLRSGAVIAGANGPSYTPVAADVGFTLQSAIVANNADGPSQPVNSLPTAPVTAAAGSVPMDTVLPTISGTAQVGQTLTATNGTWTNGPTSFTYQWNRAGSAISGATTSAYVPVVADVGNTLTISVTAANGSGSSTPATSAATSAVIDVIPTNISVPAISGTTQVGQTLTATTGTWTHNPTSFTYQWKRAGTAIGGATASAYVPVAADVGNTLTASVVATNSGGSSSSATSAATSAVIGVIPTNISVPAISGTTQVGQTLTATTGTWTHNPTSFTYQWKRAGTAIGGATASTYVPVAADVGNTLTVSVVAANSGGSSSAATSAATSAVAAGSVPVNTALPTIPGTAQVGQTVTATNGTWANSPTSFTYQWNRAGSAISGATASAYVPVAADVGNTLAISVTAANGSGSSTPAASAATSAVIDMIPTNSSVPTISGTAQVGQTLTATTGTWTHSPTSFTYQWKRAGTAIGGATASTYVPVAGDVGNTLTVSVVAANSGGSSSAATSAATSAVAAGSVPVNTALPTIAGTAQVGQTLNATNGTWTNSPTSFSYQWGKPASMFTDSLPVVGGPWAVTGSPSVTAQVRVVIPPANLANPGIISGTIRVSLTIGAGSTGVSLIGAYVGELGTGDAVSFDGNQVQLTFGGTGTPTGLGPGTIVSDRINFAFNPANSLIVSMVWGGTTYSGTDRSSTNNSAWNSGTDLDPSVSVPPTFSTSWAQQTNTDHFVAAIDFAPAPISGATASAYVPVAADSGSQLTVSVKATNAVGSSAPALSAMTSAVVNTIPANSTVPMISGTAQVGQTLTATTGTWTNSPTSFTYQWNRAGSAISGATASTYVPVAGDVGNTLTVSVVAANSGGSSSPATSAATSAVAAAGSVPVDTAPPTISGTAQVGQRLTATNGTWTNSPTNFTYQWNRAGSAISGATASTYVPIAADIGNTLTISVTAANGSGSSTPATSAATSAVIDVIPTNSSVPTISGTAQVGQTLTATTGTWTHNPTSFTYQWNRAGTAIGGATASTYVPVTGDLGNTLTVSVVATNSGGSSSPATSAATRAVTVATGGVLDFSQPSNSGLISALAA